MKRTLTAFGAGALAGYAYAFVSCLVAGKGLGRQQPPHPPGTCASDCPWDDYFEGPHQLDGEDMHDVLPTDNELKYPEFGSCRVCGAPIELDLVDISTAWDPYATMPGRALCSNDPRHRLSS